jgi:hypothetical protein
VDRAGSAALGVALVVLLPVHEVVDSAAQLVEVDERATVEELMLEDRPQRFRGRVEVAGSSAAHRSCQPDPSADLHDRGRR